MTKNEHDRMTDPLRAFPNPPDGCLQEMYTEGLLRSICGGHLYALYVDGDVHANDPILIDHRLLPVKLQADQYVRMVIAVRGKPG